MAYVYYGILIFCALQEEITIVRYRVLRRQSVVEKVLGGKVLLY